ncbi:MAG: NAD-dependent epimerase/dehydratase family protein, partial [Pseudomonadota bacterium]
PDEWAGDTDITVIKADLSDASCIEALVPHLAKTSHIIHAASAMSNNVETLKKDTRRATENLLTATTKAIEHVNLKPGFFLISSVAVYDHRGASGLLTVDPSSAVDPEPARRGHYARFKCLQEEQCAAFSQQAGVPLRIVRVGILAQSSLTWVSRMGFEAGAFNILIGANDPIQVLSVDTAAQQIIADIQSGPTQPNSAPEAHDLAARTVNIVAHPPTTKAKLHAQLPPQDQEKPTLTVSWPVFRACLSVWSALAGVLLVLSINIPGSLRPAELNARFRPVIYKTTASHRDLV